MGSHTDSKEIKNKGGTAHSPSQAVRWPLWSGLAHLTFLGRGGIMRIATLISLCIALSGVGLAQQRTLTITDGPRVESVTSNSAQIAWTTNAPAGSTLLYGTDQNVLQNRATQSWPATQVQPSGANPGMAEVPWGETTHRIQLTNLQPQTTYYFVVRSTAGQNTGGVTNSNISSFTTRGSGQANGQTNQSQWSQGQGRYGDRDQETNSPAYRQGRADGERDRSSNGSRNYRGQFDNDDDRAAYQAGYDRGYADRNGYGNADRRENRDQYDQDQNGGRTYGENGRDDSQQNAAYRNGFQDGMSDGRSDFNSGRGGDPTSTANYQNAITGYDGSFGSQSQYKDQYRRGYVRGYHRAYSGQGSYSPR